MKVIYVMLIWNFSTTWSKSRMCLVEVYDWSHRRNLQFVFWKSEWNNHLWIWYHVHCSVEKIWSL